jgi:hypothetical protein
MGCLIKSSLSALSSAEATFCPIDLGLDQFSRAYNGGFNLNFIQALSGSQSFKNLNFTNFYLSNNVLLDDVTTFNHYKVKPESFSTTLNFAHSGNAFLQFNSASIDAFKEDNTMPIGSFYGYTSITEDRELASVFEISIIDDFTCRVATYVDNLRYYLVVKDTGTDTDTREVLFVAENQLDLSAYTLEYNLLKYSTTSYINLFSQKGIVGNEFIPSSKFLIHSNNMRAVATRLSATNQSLDMFFITNQTIRMDQEINLLVPSPYNASFITYNADGNIDNSKSDFALPSNYLLYSSSNKTDQKFNIFNLKNIANTQDQFTSSNNLLSTSTTSIFSQNLREYTSLLSDVDSENNEVLAINFVYNNFDIKISPGFTYFTTPSSMVPFTALNINDSKFANCGAFSFTTPDLADRVYRLDDTTDKAENVTYLCTWLSGGVGDQGIWIDRYYYPDLVSKEAALAASSTYNITYEQAVENLIKSNASLKTSVTEKLFMDKKSDLVFEPQKRYKYRRISEEDFIRKSPTNYCETVKIGNKINNYFSTINKNGGFGLGFSILNDAGNFSIVSDRNTVDAGIQFTKTDSATDPTNYSITFTYSLFDNSTQGTIRNDQGDVIADRPLTDRVKENLFTHQFDIDKFEKNNIFLSFNAILGICKLYLNSNVIFTFKLNAYQMFTKRLLFGDIFIIKDQGNVKKEILLNEAGTNKIAINNLYLSLAPLEEDEELAVVFSTNMNQVQDISVSLPCGMRNLTDTIKTVNSINTNLKNKSNVVDINVKNLNIKETSITEEVKNILMTNILNSLPKTTNINNINFLDYKE